MPDYNPAVALDLKPPENSLAQTFNTIANLQQTQAHTGLYQLQEAQQQRDLNSKRAYANAISSGQTPAQAIHAFVINGGNPADLNQLQTASEMQTEMQRGGGLSMASLERQTAATKNRAETAKVGEETNNLRRVGLQEENKIRAGFGQELYTNPTPETLARLWPEMTKGQHISPEGVQELAGYYKNKDSEGIRGAAVRMMSRTMTPEKLAEIVQPGQVAQAAQGDQPAQAATAPQLRSPEEVAAAKQRKEYYGKMFTGLQAAGNEAASALNDARVARAAINAPGFYSGTAADKVQQLKTVASSMGINPGSSLPMELLHKVMSKSIEQQIEGMKANMQAMGESGGRLFKQQIDLMQAASQNTQISIAGNNTLTELAERSAKLSQTVASMAANYKKGNLDPGFETQMRKYMAGHPLISDAELRNPQLLADAYNARNYLKAHPETAPQFNKAYGEGAAEEYLGSSGK